MYILCELCYMNQQAVTGYRFTILQTLPASILHSDSPKDSLGETFNIPTLPPPTSNTTEVKQCMWFQDPAPTSSSMAFHLRLLRRKSWSCLYRM